jgi:hypothetical protein
MTHKIPVLAKTDVKTSIRNALSAGMSYEKFRKLVTDLTAQNGTTGPEQTAAYIQYTRLNDQRMRRWDKTLKLSEEEKLQIQTFNKKVYWLVITESWCGDAAPSLPVMNKVAQLTDGIDLRIVLRNEQPALMDAFLTNGKMSIPKLIMVDKTSLDVLGTWGPLPAKATEMATDFREQHGALTPAFKESLQQWFNLDKGRNILEGLLQLLALK